MEKRDLLIPYTRSVIPEGDGLGIAMPNLGIAGYGMVLKVSCNNQNKYVVKQAAVKKSRLLFQHLLWLCALYYPFPIVGIAVEISKMHIID